MATYESTGVPTRASLRILIEGRVQGVGYRAFVDGRARALGLEGWVRNRRDGGVEAVIAGPAASVETMLTLCRAGPRDAHVEMLRVLETGVEAGPGFEVRPTV